MKVAGNGARFASEFYMSPPPYFVPSPTFPWSLYLNPDCPVARTHRVVNLTLRRNHAATRSVTIQVLVGHDEAPTLPAWLSAYIEAWRPSNFRRVLDRTLDLRVICAAHRKPRIVRSRLRAHRNAIAYARKHGFILPSITSQPLLGGGTYNEYAYLVAAYLLFRSN